MFAQHREFKLAEDMYAQDSIELLKNSGIDFASNEARGIDVHRFGELLMSSGIVLSEEVGCKTCVATHALSQEPWLTGSELECQGGIMQHLELYSTKLLRPLPGLQIVATMTASADFIQDYLGEEVGSKERDMRCPSSMPSASDTVSFAVAGQLDHFPQWI